LVEKAEQDISVKAGGKRHVPSKRRLTFNRLHGVIYPEDRTLHNHSCEALKFRRQDGLPPAFALVSFSAYLTLKMNAICSSETTVDFKRTIRLFIPEDTTLHQKYKLL
jgi:hypothetical protein